VTTSVTAASAAHTPVTIAGTWTPSLADIRANRPERIEEPEQ
jgi:hypothetical protein